MGETPLVIVDVQRQGPATGSATKGADGDIQFMRWGTSGGLPVIVLSPENVAECYSLTIEAFNLAERFRTPVFLASPEGSGPDPRAGRPGRGQSRGPGRAGTPGARSFDPVRALRLHGLGRCRRYQPHRRPAAGALHHQHARPSGLTWPKDPEVIAECMEHLARKIDDHADEIALVDLDAQPGADTLVVAYGVTARSARNAVAQARAAGGAVSLLVLKTLFPVPEAAIAAALAGVRRVVVPEMNLGQYVVEVRRLAGDREVVSVPKMNTDLLSPGEIVAKGRLL